MMQLCELFQPGERRKMRLCAQAGATHAIAKLAPSTARLDRREYPRLLRDMTMEVQGEGLHGIVGVESHPVSAEKIKLGLHGADVEFENYRAMMEALAEAGVPMICYNWMAGLGWYRTRVDVSGRGGAFLSEFRADAAEAAGLTDWGIVESGRVWENLWRFLDFALPLAERLGLRLALHPDDPPLSPLRGIARILIRADAFDQISIRYPSPNHGITFCQANFLLMGEDLQALARRWGAQGRIHFLHVRDVAGSRTDFQETFHDDGPTDLGALLRVYQEAGIHVPLRPDHAPAFAGEEGAELGYGVLGKLVAIGYLKGLLDAHKIPYFGGKTR